MRTSSRFIRHRSPHSLPPGQLQIVALTILNHFGRRRRHLIPAKILNSFAFLLAFSWRLFSILPEQVFIEFFDYAVHLSRYLERLPPPTALSWTSAKEYSSGLVQSRKWRDYAYFYCHLSNSL